ncbi:MAG: hypothetical protein AAFP97_09315 [Pseudomonadota bacterium]
MKAWVFKAGIRNFSISAPADLIGGSITQPFQPDETAGDGQAVEASAIHEVDCSEGSA